MLAGDVTDFADVAHLNKSIFCFRVCAEREPRLEDDIGSRLAFQPVQALLPIARVNERRFEFGEAFIGLKKYHDALNLLHGVMDDGADNWIGTAARALDCLVPLHWKKADCTQKSIHIIPQP